MRFSALSTDSPRVGSSFPEVKQTSNLESATSASDHKRKVRAHIDLAVSIRQDNRVVNTHLFGEPASRGLLLWIQARQQWECRTLYTLRHRAIEHDGDDAPADASQKSHRFILSLLAGNGAQNRLDLRPKRLLRWRKFHLALDLTDVDVGDFCGFE